MDSNLDANLEFFLAWKNRVLNNKSPSLCAAKWYNASIWLQQGWTTSCHHNPPHQISVEDIQKNPSALHNTEIKANEREMMKTGKRPANCQFCWVVEDMDPNALADRYWLSSLSTEDEVSEAFNAPSDQHFDLTYLEIAFDRTCQLACSYCCSSISSTWAKDIDKHGPYTNLDGDHRGHYVGNANQSMKHKSTERNPYSDAFFKWWDNGLGSSLRMLRINGGEPLMSHNVWKLLDRLAINSVAMDPEFKIYITTNLMFDKETIDRFLNKCEQISVPIIPAVSMETVGAMTEYVRDGVVWEQLEENLDTLIQSSAIEDINITGTHGIPGIEGIGKFLYWLLEKKLFARDFNKSLTLACNFVRFPTFQNIVLLPAELRTQFANQIDGFLEHIKSTEELGGLITHIEFDHIQRLANYVRSVEQPHKEETKKHTTDSYEEQTGVLDLTLQRETFKNFFNQYDKRRNKNLVETFPTIGAWYNEL